MRTRFIILTVIIICLLWYARQSRHVSSPARPVIEQEIVPQKSVADSPINFQAVVPIKTVPTESPGELILAKLQAWDDDDRPDLREQRIQELAALLEGTNALELIQGIPANLMGYAFAVPSVREELMANPEAALDWMSQHANVQGQLQTFLHDWGQS